MYDVPKSQLNFIRIGSRYAVQTLTYKCRNSEASVILQTQINSDITPTSVKYDGCQGRPSHGDHSVLEVMTRKVAQLPIKDIAVSDFGESHQEFGFEMGPACFY